MMHRVTYCTRICLDINRPTSQMYSYRQHGIYTDTGDPSRWFQLYYEIIHWTNSLIIEGHIISTPETLLRRQTRDRKKSVSLLAGQC